MTAYALPASDLIRKTPLGVSEDKEIILQRSIQAYTPYARQLVDETEREIEALRELPADWDGEAAEPIARQAVFLAKRLTLNTAVMATERGLRWLPPSVAPNPEGGIDLTWVVGARKALVIIHPQRQEVTFIDKRGISAPQRRVLPVEAAEMNLLSTLSMP